MKKTKIIFLGTAELAVPVLKALLKSQSWEVTAVYTKPDQKQGRGLKRASSPVKELVEKINRKREKSKRKIILEQPRDFKSREAVEKFKVLAPDMAVVAAYGLLLPQEILAIPRLGCLNVHPSLLPKYRGPSPIQAALLNRDEFSGVTIIKLNERMDAGDILAQEKVRVASKITAPKLSKRLAELGGELLIEMLPRYLQGKIRPKKQNEEEATYTKMIRKEAGRIDWKKPACEIEAMIRVYKPWPGVYTFFKTKKKGRLRLEITEANLVGKSLAQNDQGRRQRKNREDQKAGQVFLKPGFKYPLVATGAGFLELRQIKPEGKSEMDVLAFMNGYQDFKEAVLG